jgi:hypothetical protein
MERPQYRKENSAGELGQAMSTQGARRLGTEGSLHHEQGAKHQNLVAMAKNPQGVIGPNMEEEICSEFSREEPYPLE